MSRARDLAGQRFGRLVALRHAGKRGKKLQWLCQCDCGRQPAVNTDFLTLGRTTSCGCLREEIRGVAQRTHGRSKSRVWNIWTGVRKRCLNPNCTRWKWYGGRGITVCERWAKFEHFLADMGEPPTDKHTIDRIDNDGNYEPGNCRWALMTEQAKNRRPRVFSTQPKELK